MIILIGSQKGGVGKSTLSTNLSALLASTGKDVVLVDADETRVEIDTVIEKQQISVGVNRRDRRGEIDQVRAASPRVVVAVSRLSKGSVDTVGIDVSSLRPCGRILQSDRCEPRRLSDVVSCDNRRARVEKISHVVKFDDRCGQDSSVFEFFQCGFVRRGLFHGKSLWEMDHGLRSTGENKSLGHQV